MSRGGTREGDDERGPEATERRDLAGERRAGDDEHGGQQKRDAGLERAVAVDVLEVEREEVENRAEGRDEQERDHDSRGEIPVGEQPG